MHSKFSDSTNVQVTCLADEEILLQIQLKFLAEEMQAINKGLEKVMQELSMAESDGPVSEHFCQVHPKPCQYGSWCFHLSMRNNFFLPLVCYFKVCIICLGEVLSLWGTVVGR